MIADSIDAFTPITNFPECAIPGVGHIIRQPVADGEAIVLRDIITLSPALDHGAFHGLLPRGFCKLRQSPSKRLRKRWMAELAGAPRPEANF